MKRRPLDGLLVGALLASLLIGWFVASRTPPFGNPDEAAHFLRAVEIAHGKLLNRPGDSGVDIVCRDYFSIAARHAPMAWYRDTTRRADFELDSCRVRSSNTAGTYAPVSYVFAAPAEWAGRRLGQTVEQRLVGMRLANLLGSTALLGIALRLVPQRRAGFLLLAFSPLAVWLRASVSADGVTIALALLLLAWLLRLLGQAQPPAPRQWALLGAIGLALALCKPVYALLVLFATVLAFRPDPGVERVRSALLGAALGGAAVALSLVWAALADPALIQLGHGAEPRAQLAFGLEHPARFLHALQAGIGWRIVYELWSLHRLPEALAAAVAASLSALLLLVPAGGAPFLHARAGRAFAALFFLLLLPAIATPLYLTYTPVGHALVIGVQGRYFYPALGVLLFALAGAARPLFVLPQRLADALCSVLPLGLCAYLIASR